MNKKFFKGYFDLDDPIEKEVYEKLSSMGNKKKHKFFIAALSSYIKNETVYGNKEQDISNNSLIDMSYTILKDIEKKIDCIIDLQKTGAGNTKQDVSIENKKVNGKINHINDNGSIKTKTNEKAEGSSKESSFPLTDLTDDEKKKIKDDLLNW